MKKVCIFLSLILAVFLCSEAIYATTQEEADIYNNLYYPRSVYNGGISTSPQESKQEIYVDPITGSAHVNVTDITLPGANGFDLNITRTYNSTNASMYEAYLKETEIAYPNTYYMITGAKRVYISYTDGSYTTTPYGDICLTSDFFDYLDTKTAEWMVKNTSKFEYAYTTNPAKSKLFTSRSEAEEVVSYLNSEFFEIDATFPYTNTSKYEIDYYNFSVVAVKKTDYYTDYADALLDNTLTERYSGFGIGWQFNFPYIEKRYGNDWYEYLHYGDKGSWEIGSGNKLIGYTLNDIVLTYDSSVTHDGKQSEYCVTEKNGKKSYFGSDGRLLLQRDRYGNEIKFYHSTQYYYDTAGTNRKYPYITGITDSVGRTVSISYGSEYTKGSTTYKDITLTVTDPKNSANNVTYTYKMEKLNHSAIDEDKYVLRNVIRPDGEQLSYTYSYMEAPVSFFNRNEEFAAYYMDSKNWSLGNSYINADNLSEIEGISNYYALLSHASEPDGRKYRFNYGRFLKNCTPTGSMLFFKAYYKCDDVRWDENDDQYQANEHFYKYFILDEDEYDGYPVYFCDSRIPDNFRIAVKDIYGDERGGTGELVTSTYTYRYTEVDDIKTILMENSQSSSIDFKTTVDYTYDDTTNLVTNILTKQYDSPSATEYMQLSEAYVYDTGAYGDVISYTPNSDTDRTISYEYNSEYHYPIKKTYKRDASQTVVEEYTPTTDNKSIKSEKIYENGLLKKTVEYAHDSYGNIIQKKEYTSDTGDYIRTDYSYTDTQYNGQYTGANLMSETVYNVSDNDGATKNVSKSYTYDWRGNPITVTDANGNTTLYEYDSLNRVIKETAPDGSIQTVGFDYGGEEVTLTDALGTKFIYYYDGTGNLLEECIDTWRNQIKLNWYDRYNNLIKEIIRSDGNYESTTLYTYDTLQRPVSKEIYDSSNTLVYKETYSYDTTITYNKKTTTVWGGDNNPSVVTSEYTDKYGNKIKTETGSSVETYTTDYAGNILTIKSAKANAEGKTEVKSFEYDYMGNAVKETNELGVVTSAEYDSLGRMIKSTDADGNVTEYTYDEMGRLIMQKTPFETVGGTTYYSVKKIWYDNNGNVIKERVNTNASGEAEKFSETKHTYDNRNRLVMTETNDGEESNYVQYYYDVKGNLLRVYKGLSSPLTISGLDTVTDSGDSEYSVIKYTYDSLGRLLTTTDALGNTETNTYDEANGLLLSSTDRNGNNFSYTYDGAGKLTSKALSDGTNAETTTYGLTGQVLSMQNGTTTISYAYNDKGQLISETDSNVGTVKEYTYDANGNRLTFTLKRNGVTEISQSYTYDMLNRLTSVSENGTVIASYSYDNRNNRISTVTGNETTTYAYNLAGLLTNQTASDKLTESYTYYLNGNQKSKTSNGEETSYTYDLMNRLVKENETEYTFDDFGNRLTMSDGESTSTYLYDLNNRLTESNEVSGDTTKNTKYFYDNNGNTVSKAVMTNTDYTGDNTGYNYLSENSDKNVALYDYNCYNQVTGVDTNGVKSSYTYSPDGLRFSKTVGEDTITFVYDGANIVEEVTEDGANKYYRGLEIIKNSDGLFYIYNGQGDVAILEDANGETVASYIFDAYGNSESDNTVYNPFGYRGEYQDSESGLIYLRARMYDPETGRFISEDPVEDGLNWYVYCGNNPIMFIDPWGLAEGDLTLNNKMIDRRYLRDYDSGQYASARDIISGYEGWVEQSNYKNIYVFCVGSSCFTVNLNSINYEQLGKTNSIKLDGSSATMSIRYTLTSDFDVSGATKVLLNVSDMERLATNEGIDTTYAWEMGVQGGTHRYGDYINGGVSTYIPTSKINEVYSINSIVSALGSLKGADTASIEDALGDFLAGFITSELKKGYLNKQIQSNPPYIGVYTSNTLGVSDGPYTSTHNSKYINCSAYDLGRFYPGSYSNF